MKTQVLQYFNDLPKSKIEQYNEAFQLYRKCSAKSLAQESFYNRAGFSPVNLKNLQYDLKKAVGVTNADIRNFNNPEKVPQKPSKTPPTNTIKVTVTSKEEVFTTAPDEVKEAVKLRDQFPFLNDKDCPEEFYILVGKKLSHYNAYVAAHDKLLVNITDTNEDASPIAMTVEEVNELALMAVEDFKINQAIYAELTHYAENGKVLGEHPIFKERQLKESVDALTVEKATKRLSNLDNYIRRDTKLAEKATEESAKLKYNNKVKNWKIEQGLIKAKFGFSDEK
ncbi:hypothetical protein [Tenacibaculum soleae]|uniref:hypothetical protein n=1 Tax=Tenacibaculum soleae TaxID=447689 RepID=UPI0023003A88|nr:hypothetical protein [Tenacibaculum soleae]